MAYNLGSSSLRWTPVLLIQEVTRGNVTESGEYERTMTVPQTVSCNPLIQQKMIERHFQAPQYQLQLWAFILVLKYEMWKNLFYVFPRVSFNWLSELIVANYDFSKGLQKIEFILSFKIQQSTGISRLMVKKYLAQKTKTCIFLSAFHSVCEIDTWEHISSSTIFWSIQRIRGFSWLQV